MNLPPSTWPPDVPYHNERTADAWGTSSPWWTSSALKSFRACPASAHRRYILGQPEAAPALTEDVRVGHAVHQAILEPTQGLRVVEVEVPPKKETTAQLRRRKTDEGFGHRSKVTRREFSAFAGLLREDKTPGNAYRRALGAFWTIARPWWLHTPDVEAMLKEIDDVRAAYIATDSLAMVHRWLAHPHGQREYIVHANDLDTGVPIKARFDLLIPARGKLIVPDFKVTADVSPWTFAKRVKQFGYVEQAAHYRRVARAATGDPALEVDWFWAAVQSRAVNGRHPVVTYRLQPERIDRADERLAVDLERLADCLRSGDWPAGLVPGESWADGAPEVPEL